MSFSIWQFFCHSFSGVQRFTWYHGIMTTQMIFMMVYLFPMDLEILHWHGMLFWICERFAKTVHGLLSGNISRHICWAIVSIVILVDLWGPPTAWCSLAFYGLPRRWVAEGINMENVLKVEHFDSWVCLVNSLLSSLRTSLQQSVINFLFQT